MPDNLPTHYDVFLNLIVSVLKDGRNISFGTLLSTAAQPENHTQNAHGLQNL
jgi:hypothetical protein